MLALYLGLMQGVAEPGGCATLQKLHVPIYKAIS